jgi:hypothetical protein
MSWKTFISALNKHAALLYPSPCIERGLTMHRPQHNRGLLSLPASPVTLHSIHDIASTLCSTRNITLQCNPHTSLTFTISLRQNRHNSTIYHTPQSTHTIQGRFLPTMSTRSSGNTLALQCYTSIPLEHRIFTSSKRDFTEYTQSDLWISSWSR